VTKLCVSESFSLEVTAYSRFARWRLSQTCFHELGASDSVEVIIGHPTTKFREAASISLNVTENFFSRLLLLPSWIPQFNFRHFMVVQLQAAKFL
jgi:hypothetical protein